MRHLSPTQKTLSTQDVFFSYLWFLGITFLYRHLFLRNLFLLYSWLPFFCRLARLVLMSRRCNTGISGILSTWGGVKKTSPSSRTASNCKGAMTWVGEGALKSWLCHNMNWLMHSLRLIKLSRVGWSILHCLCSGFTLCTSTLLYFSGINRQYNVLLGGCASLVTTSIIVVYLPIITTMIHGVSCLMRSTGVVPTVKAWLLGTFGMVATNLQR